MRNKPLIARDVILTLLLPLLIVPPSFGWGSDGHRIINQVAMEKLPPDLPAFMRTPQALDEIEYLGPEPDRWRSSSEPELSEAQAPDHFLDLELADLAAPHGLPAQRFEFLRDLQTAQRRNPKIAAMLAPEKVGLLPWQTMEEFERLVIDMRSYRALLKSHRDVKPVQQAILYDTGLLGHYVADGSQPLHTTVNYNGWVEAKNPERFTRRHGIHSQFESEFVRDNIDASEVASLVPAAPHRLPRPFHDFVAYLRASNSRVPELYRLAKRHFFEGNGTAHSRSFTAERMAAGASMFRDMIYTAWLQSAEPLPDVTASF